MFLHSIIIVSSSIAPLCALEMFLVQTLGYVFRVEITYVHPFLHSHVRDLHDD